MNFINRIIKTYKNGKKYPDLKQKYDHLKSKLDEEESEQKSLTQKVDELQSALKEARASIKQLKKDDASTPNPEDLKNFFMYPDEQITWMYPIRGGNDIPVTHAFSVADDSGIVAEAQKVVKKGGLRRKNNPTQVADYFYRYVENNWDWDYTTDRKNFGKIEYWMAPDDALEEMEGDCDDKALAMHMVLRQVLKEAGFGNSVWRIRFAASRTLAGGHAYNIWLGEDCEWYVMESTMDAEGSRAKTWGNTPLRENNFYYDFYGFATPEQTWRGDLDVVEPHQDDEHDHFMET